ncbi:MAG: ATP-binding protein [Bacteroidia bacterium]
MSELGLLLISVLYLLGLFLIAFYSENRLNKLTNNGWVYALSLMVYCTAWTFYGSVGKAATDGISFLAIYIGPLLTVPFWWVVLRKIVRVTRTMRISSIADFISLRYGKHNGLGSIVAIACLLAVIPYIALQLKAISNSIILIQGEGNFNYSLVIAIILVLFAVLFGARNVDANQRKNGLINAIAFESIIKLLAFVVVGFVVVYVLNNGITDIYAKANTQFSELAIFGFGGEMDYGDWFFTTLVSAFAFFLLPRQFQVASVEASDEKHILTAMRIVPVYLLVINIFVIPIALAGYVLSNSGNTDFLVLSLPLLGDFKLVTILAYLGGFSAATSMILVSTTALSTMLSNYVFLPFLLRSRKEDAIQKTNYQNTLLLWRRISIVIIIGLSFLYYKFFTGIESLVSIGLVSFVGVAQLAPAFFGGLFWKKPNQKAASRSILVGLSIWFVLLVLPNLLGHLEVVIGSVPVDFAEVTTEYISKQMGLSHLSSTILLSLGANFGVFAWQSLAHKQSPKELNQAELFVDIYNYSESFDSSVAWRGKAFFLDIKSLLAQFLGNERTERALERYAKRNGISFENDSEADAKLVSYAERVLTGIIGPASARIMISRVVQEEEIGISDVLDILQESQEVIALNRELRNKSRQLEKATGNLKAANDKLKEYSDLKNEFLYTVTHELRTPITSIRAMAEIVQDMPEMEADEKDEFISQIINESERMTKLIGNVLDLEKFESGSQLLERNELDLKALVIEEANALKPLIGDKNIALNVEINSALATVYADFERIRQVLNNLISNAIKYCDQNNGKITITAYNRGEEVKVNISNNGPGIAQEDIKNIFDKFYQIKNQTKRKPQGHGLGLAICKNIIEMHKGKISVEMLHNNVRFSFSLPRYIKSE